MNQTVAAGLTVLFQRGHLREMAPPTLVGAVALLISAVILLGANVSVMRRNFDWVQQADDVLLQISAVESGVIGDELSVRGYALTDDPQFLAYQRANRRSAANSMKKLGALVASDGSQAARYRQLQRIIARHADIFGTLTSLGPGHALAVASAIVDKGNRAVMDEMRAQIASFRADELLLLKERQAAAAEQASRSYATAMVIVVAAFLLGALGVVMSQFGRKAA